MNHHEQELKQVINTLDTDTTNGNRLGPVRRVAGAAAAVTLALTLAACGSVAAEGGPKDDDKSNSASPSPEASQTPEVEKPTELSIEIPAGLEAQEVGELIVGELFTDWNNAGAENSLLDLNIESGKDWSVFLPELAAANAQEYADGMFVAGWQNDENLVKIVSGAEATNLSNLDMYKSTAWSDKYEEGFRSWKEVLAVEELQDEDPNSRSIEVTYVEHNNADKSAGEPASGTETIFSLRLAPDPTDGGKTEDIIAASVRSK